MKTCSKCKKVKPEDQFYIDKSKKEGLRKSCKECDRQRVTAYRKANPKPSLAYKRAEQEANREKLRGLLAAKGLKTCSHCKEVKSILEFSKNRREKDGMSHYCKPCHSVTNQECLLRLPPGEKARRRFVSQMRCIYGLEPEDFAQIKLNQQNKCAVCQEVFDTSPNVDHCHKTGKVRGLLCRLCNQGIGQFKDSPERLRSAANYLDKAHHLG